MKISDITGHLVLIMAPTGSGKGSLIRHIKKVLPDITYSVSCTTRAKRHGEQEGANYHFLTRNEFEQKINENAFIEWAEYGGNLYGTLEKELEERLLRGEIVITELELQGVRQLVDIIPPERITVIYVDGGDWETLKERILARAPMSEEELDLRHARYLKESAYKDKADFIIKNGNGMLKEAEKEIEKILRDIIEKQKNT